MFADNLLFTVSLLTTITTVVTASEPKVALVTGSSSGIGEETAKLLTQNGYKVVITGSNPEKVERVAKECAELSPQKYQPLALVLDLSNPENGRLAVEKTIDHFGRLDVLINNAGIFNKIRINDPRAYEVYREMMTINTDSTVQTTLAAINELRRTKGNLIFVSSVRAVVPSENGFSYCMSKAAMSMFAKCLAIDLAPDVHVNIVSPGPVITPIYNRIGISEAVARSATGPMTLVGRAGESKEIAAIIAFLISDDAAFIQGQELIIDGGYSIKPSSLPPQLAHLNSPTTS